MGLKLKHIQVSAFKLDLKARLGKAIKRLHHLRDNPVLNSISLFSHADKRAMKTPTFEYYDSW